jgi:TPR repeat protein
MVSASHGDLDAQVALGDMFKEGLEVRQDYQATMDWYLKAAEQGNAEGQAKVGLLYYLGMGVRQNCSTAMNWYYKATN